jgi:hypothetical protein
MQHKKGEEVEFFLETVLANSFLVMLNKTLSVMDDPLE